MEEDGLLSSTGAAGSPRRARFDEKLKFLPVAYVVVAMLLLAGIYLQYHISPLLSHTAAHLQMPDAAAAGEIRGLIQLSLFVPVTALLLICYVRSILTHPGEIPDDPKWEYMPRDKLVALAPLSLQETKKSGERRHCKWCGKYKPDRCHHCRVCRTCILKMDHHCPWIYNCVGCFNYKFFILLLFYSALDCHLIVWSMSESVLRCVNIEETPFKEMFMILFGECLALILALLVTAFLAMHLWLISKGLTTIEFCEKSLPKDGQPAERSLTSVYDLGLYGNFCTVLGSSELATATITLRGSFTAAYLPIIEAALESVLGMFCDDESILIFTERLVSDVGGGTYSMTVEFQILPPRDGGGDCAWELIAAADGADAAPFEECEDCVRKKPLFRRALENQIWMYPGARNLPLASWYVKMFSIFCHRLDVVRPRNFPSMQTQDWRCEDFFVEATAHPPDPGAVTTTAASGGAQTTTQRVASSDDPCSWISSSCLCATVPRCSWNGGLGTCVEVTVPHSDSERCGFCPTLPWCDPSPAQECPTALTICSCALMGPQCNWTLATGRCFAPASGPTGVPCSLCPLSTANCPRPIVTRVTPPADTLLGWGDNGYDLTVTFDRPVRLPRPSDTITGDIFLICELEAGQFIPWDAPQGGTLRIEVPESKRLILNGGLQVRLQLSNNSFWSRYLCTLNIQDGAMVDVAEDVPCVAASWHRASMSDNMAPLATTIVPDSGLRDISIDVSEATVRFNEPVYLMAIREATLYQLDPNNGPERYNEVAKLPVTLTDTVEIIETLKISLSDVRLEHDSVYSIHVPAGVVVDRANNGFAGLEVGVWAFRTEIGGTVEQLDFGLPAGAIAGIAAGLVVFVAAIACGLVFFRWKVVRKYEDSRVKPEEGGTPKASQVQTLHNDAEHLPSNERFWERALVRSKEDLADAEADELEELPGTIHSHHGSRRPSVASNSETNQRRPSVGSNFETNQRRPSNASSTAPVGRVRNESKQSSQNSRRPSKSTDMVQFYSNEPRRPSNVSALGTGSQNLRSAGLAGKLQAKGDGTQSASIGERRPSRNSHGASPRPPRETSPSRFLEGSQVLREEAEGMAASRRAMLGLGPAQPPKPHTVGSSRQSPRPIAT